MPNGPDGKYHAERHKLIATIGDALIQRFDGRSVEVATDQTVGSTEEVLATWQEIVKYIKAKEGNSA